MNNNHDMGLLRWRRFGADAMTIAAALPVTFAAVGAADVLYSMLFAAALLAIGLILEPKMRVETRDTAETKPSQPAPIQYFDPEISIAASA